MNAIKKQPIRVVLIFTTEKLLVFLFNDTKDQ